ncbi:hypothetical protein PR003_g24660 [Phytophthora rubi]|uniref:Uncharacterized protein n=1 Tax=Phytophthora rubi TaxID=129364 RepID=A0A6A4CM17_9STRA|nr:hypothetical protein PR002_g29379 [Phytophthora rubi]KAE9292826.1 hypothetical protein PR003_g24660 [Phytophthora rubi]
MATACVPGNGVDANAPSFLLSSQLKAENPTLLRRRTVAQSPWDPEGNDRQRRRCC